MTEESHKEYTVADLTTLNLNIDPFNLSSDPSFVYLGGQYGEVVRLVQEIINFRKGSGLIVGDPGMGKSSLARLIFNYYFEREDIVITYIPSASFNTPNKAAKGFINALAELDVETTVTYEGNMKVLFSAVQEAHNANKNVVVLLDEAQLITKDAVLMLHEVYNFDFDKKALQVISFGQIGTRERFRSFGEKSEYYRRIHRPITLNPLAMNETIEMVGHRLRQAGRHEALFSDEALLDLYDTTAGIPREIVRLCSMSLSILISQNGSRVDKTIMNKAISQYEP